MMTARCDLNTELDVLKPRKVCGRPTTLVVELVRGKVPACVQCILESQGYIQPYQVFTLTKETYNDKS